MALNKPAARAASEARAELEMTERLLNAFLRETRQFDPRLRDEGEGRAAQAPEEALALARTAAGEPVRVALAATGVVIVGVLRYYSPMGHHKYGEGLWACCAERDGSARDGGGRWRPLGGFGELSGLILAELDALDGSVLDGSGPDGGTVRLAGQLSSSLANMRLYLADGADGLQLVSGGGAALVRAAEQSLRCGHPFHPTPKSSAGFSADDMRRYAPELGAAFRLHYIAAAPELTREQWLGEARPDVIPPGVREEAAGLLAAGRQHYRLLPAHPWQAAYLQRLEEVRALMEQGQLCFLGELGEPVVPTSSVRTVWSADNRFMYKLPLQVKITNFTRVNPPEQLERAIWASRMAAAVAPLMPFGAFDIILEEGYRTVAYGRGPEDAAAVIGEPDERAPFDNGLAASFGVVFRRNPAMSGLAAERDGPLVVASLLEAPAASATALAQAVRQAARSRAGRQPDGAFAADWLRAYTELSLVPLVWLFAEHGVSLESHVQNSLVTLEHGWPVHFYARDLEGISVSRQRAQRQRFWGLDVAPDSPALYDDREAFKRLQYYVLVNHYGHLVHTLACCVNADEQALWRVVRDVLEHSPYLSGPEGAACVSGLIGARELPAKANLLSWHSGRGEHPVYVGIPNPLHRRGSDA